MPGASGEDGLPGPLGWDPLDVNVPRALLATLVVVTAVALVLAASTSSAAFGPFNPSWDGASTLRDVGDRTNTDTTIVRDASAYEDRPAAGTVAVVLSPAQASDEADAASRRQFVERGGTLVVAEDFGPHGNALLADVGAETRVDGRLVRDERHSYRSPAMPVAGPVGDHPLTAGVERLTLNHGTVLRANGARPLANTSGYAYLDENGNGTLDDQETLGARPVVTVEAVGDGRVIAVADPSLFINAMVDRPGNARFVENLVGGHDRLLLDYSHAESLPPLAVGLLVLRGSGPLQVLALLVPIGLLAAWSRGHLDGLGGGGEPDRPPVDEAAILAGLRERHPDWEETRLARVAKGVLSTRHNAEPDD